MELESLEGTPCRGLLSSLVYRAASHRTASFFTLSISTRPLGGRSVRPVGFRLFFDHNRRFLLAQRLQTFSDVVSPALAGIVAVFTVRPVKPEER
jgi:hypothetical protein